MPSANTTSAPAPAAAAAPADNPNRPTPSEETIVLAYLRRYGLSDAASELSEIIQKEATAADKKGSGGTNSGNKNKRKRDAAADSTEDDGKKKLPPIDYDANEDSMVLDEEDGDGADSNGRRARRLDRQEEEVRMCHSQILQLRKDMVDEKFEHLRFREEVRKNFTIINDNVLRVYQLLTLRGAPVQGTNLPMRELNDTSNNNDDGDESTHIAKLCRLPKTLQDLWYEWEHGFAGQKPVRLFTAKERGKVKHTYYKRKFFWQKCAELIRSGMSHSEACNKIYAVYGQNESVTHILIQMKGDKLSRGGHPQLRI